MQLILLSRSRAVARCVQITALKIWLAGGLLIAGLALAVSMSSGFSDEPVVIAGVEMD